MSPGRDKSNNSILVRNQDEKLPIKKQEQSGDTPSEPTTLIEELKIYQAELEIQNEELRESHSELARMHEEYVDLYYNFAPSAYITMNSSGLITRINLTGVKLLNASSITLEMTPFGAMIDKPDLSAYYKTLRSISKSGGTESVELRLKRNDESMIRARANIRADLDEKGKLFQYRMHLTDITREKEAEEALKKSYDEMELKVRERTAELEKLNEDLKNEIERRKRFEEDLRRNGEKILEEQNRRRFLSGKLVEILERERKEMAHTLHDEVGQALVTIKTDLDFLKENRDGCDGGATDEIEKIQDKIRGMMEYFSGLSHGLTPYVLRDFGLVTAVEKIIQNIREKSKLRVHFYTRDIPLHISEEKDLAVYRIVQEGVTNCLKYARADNLFINMVMRDNSLLLTLEDDGIGFVYEHISVGKNEREKLGLSIMKERAVQAGGDFHIESQPGKGTQIIVEIPVG